MDRTRGEEAAPLMGLSPEGRLADEWRSSRTGEENSYGERVSSEKRDTASVQPHSPRWVVDLEAERDQMPAIRSDR